MEWIVALIIGVIVFISYFMWRNQRVKRYRKNAKRLLPSSYELKWNPQIFEGIRENKANASSDSANMFESTQPMRTVDELNQMDKDYIESIEFAFVSEVEKVDMLMNYISDKYHNSLQIDQLENWIGYFEIKDIRLVALEILERMYDQVSVKDQDLSKDITVYVNGERWLLEKDQHGSKLAQLLLKGVPEYNEVEETESETETKPHEVEDTSNKTRDKWKGFFQKAVGKMKKSFKSKPSTDQALHPNQHALSKVVKQSESMEALYIQIEQELRDHVYRFNEQLNESFIQLQSSYQLRFEEEKSSIYDRQHELVEKTIHLLKDLEGKFKDLESQLDRDYQTGYVKQSLFPSYRDVLYQEAKSWFTKKHRTIWDLQEQFSFQPANNRYEIELQYKQIMSFYSNYMVDSPEIKDQLQSILNAIYETDQLRNNLKKELYAQVLETEKKLSEEIYQSYQEIQAQKQQLNKLLDEEQRAFEGNYHE
ncbi:hypothetical protein [Halalkalibacillus halophilus]|uniref:hypothetical protein n=1 Tax=Halalkalibacillus halophilus TaxID=392827 RepID=UPI000427D7CA|nr:hypothetical protein [Halalkalibacillus halophilus]